MTGAPVRIERHGDVALIVIDDPPLNVLGHAVRAGLVAALAALAADPGLRAGVIAGQGRSFPAGGDIREFDAPSLDPLLLGIAQTIEDSPKPIVAALHGTALGGGYELALACHARVIAPDGVVGLPEVKVGVIPGAGGTQRLPRLVAPLLALELILTGRHVPAGEALALGLVDEVSTDPREAAIGRARGLADAGAWPRTGARAPGGERSVLAEAVDRAITRARGALAPAAAARAVASVFDLPLAEGLARDQPTGGALRLGPQSRALRHLFVAERRALRLPARTWPVRHAGVVGGGTMGAGIAVALADAGLEVTLVELSDAAATAAEQRIRAVYDRHLRARRLTADGHADRLARIRLTTVAAALADADLVIEAVIEDLAAKQEVFRTLSAVTRRGAILASNTSYLDIDLLADMVDAPERVLGLHFFSPAHVMRLLEVVRARRTLDEVVDTARALARRLGKLPVVCGVCDGFIGNRMLSRWRLQCEYALEDGAWPEEVDAALEAYGFAMGPFAVADLAGLDIGWANRRRHAATRDRDERYVPVADWICERGRFGQKTGAGWYVHGDGRRQPDKVVRALIERASDERGIARHAVPAEAIQQRVHAAMVNEGCRILAEGIAARPADIDLVLVHGYGYPAWRGGPMHEADAIGIPQILARVEAIHAADGAGWAPAPLLRDLAGSGRSFAELDRAG